MIRLVPRTQFGFWPTVFPLLIALALTTALARIVVGMQGMVVGSTGMHTGTGTAAATAMPPHRT